MSVVIHYLRDMIEAAIQSLEEKNLILPISLLNIDVYTHCNICLCPLFFQL